MEAYQNYIKDGVDPVNRREGNCSQFKGVWHSKLRGKWTARCNGKHLGHHATEEAAARAHDKYVRDGLVPVLLREGSTSLFKGVGWNKSRGKWMAMCNEKYLGYHATEEAAARAYDKKAERLGRVDFNIIPPTGDAGDAGGADDGDNPAAPAALALLSLAAGAYTRPLFCST